MSSLDSFILIGASVGCLWGLWLLLEFTFDAIENYHRAWREAQAETEGSAKPKIGARSSDSR
jgi:hypothetical protein